MALLLILIILIHSKCQTCPINQNEDKDQKYSIANLLNQQSTFAGHTIKSSNQKLHHSKDTLGIPQIKNQIEQYIINFQQHHNTYQFPLINRQILAEKVLQKNQFLVDSLIIDLIKSGRVVIMTKFPMD